jgi:predicted PurR-regulated permease PerM
MSLSKKSKKSSVKIDKKNNSPVNIVAHQHNDSLSKLFTLLLLLGVFGGLGYFMGNLKNKETKSDNSNTTTQIKNNTRQDNIEEVSNTTPEPAEKTPSQVDTNTPKVNF